MSCVSQKIFGVYFDIRKMRKSFESESFIRNTKEYQNMTCCKSVVKLIVFPNVCQTFEIYYVFLFHQEYWQDSNGRRRPARRGINLTSAQFICLQTQLDDVKANAQRLLDDHAGESNSHGAAVLRRIPTVRCLHDGGDGAASPSATATAAAAAGVSMDRSTSVETQQANNECLLHQVMGRPQNYWRTPTTYSPALDYSKA